MTFDKRLSATIELEFPIEIAGVAVKSVTMRRPKVRDEVAMQRIKGTPSDQAAWLLATLCELAPDEFEQLDAVDSDRLMEQYLAFKGKALSQGSAEE
ncbi:phage tail assembly protein [Synechococcus elongatus]|uniref:Phage tail assembly protein n=1 Tax=Synechococcus elongatus (strain ATCC 33912 / PCC 7942 / FACHB-805) TaxID=1140 RepID=Q31Q88_SYNE7|nr:phage tail assembly protein [Synechococcus elongatus]ABB56781.1 hypothetical protein Synpcc7942_0749 [Synechococcus elongatus PCC 7942 = FACHB-805]AJD58678.1 hypothetical protein M744_12995 [Synechococcus elongatus UTEX 2973]MBD2588645.1 phage tail assembly protein [Synechococcus elongatus FACHB-242]MBD2689766.1 phage tail assembly protein [Synechococcus elongatus FACHB-1061]MBD2708373.1 phage tail assembly protein [Synechococcus elongatus PCC 7942 = FACHB-805]